MTFDDLGRVWQEQGTGDFQRRKVENLSTARGRAEKMLEGIRRHGTRSAVFTLLLCTPIFAFGVLESQRPWLAGAGSVILLAWLVRMLLRVQRFGAPRSGAPQPVRVAVASEVSRLRLLEQFWGRQNRSFPVFVVGEVLAFEGFRPPGYERGLLSALFYIGLFTIVAYAVVARGRDARTKVRPLREELESWLAGLDAFDFDGELDAGMQGGTR